MKMTNILHPTDFSECSYAAMDYARTLAQKFDADLTLLYVLDEVSRSEGWYVPHISLDEFYKEMEASARKKLEHCCYEELRGLNVNSVIKKGHPHEQIVQYADGHGIDLIVMGAYSKSGMDLLFGTTTRKVLKKADCPVLCVKVQAGQASAMHQEGP